MALFAGRYELGAVIGTGGMAEVRAATDTRLDRPVAVKLMRPAVANQPLVRERFEAEARLAARLSHPNVVAIFDSGEDQGIPFIVMERLSGESLHDRLAAGPMRAEDARTMIVDVLSALEVAHASGVLHRDIKPANILDGGNGHWKVADFGIAKALEVGGAAAGSAGADATVAGVVLGTPAYLAPERLFGSPATIESDLYSVGVVGYEALAGRRPYESSTVEGWAGQAAVAPVVPLSDVRPGVDVVLAAALERALAKEPTARYTSALEMAAAVSGAAPATQLLTAAPATQAMAAASPGTEVLAAAARPRPVVVAEERSRTGAIIAALVALAVVAAVIIAIIATHNNSGGSPTPATTAPGAPTSSSSSTSSTTSTSTSTSSSTTTPSTTSTTVAPTTTTLPPATTTTLAPVTTTTAAAVTSTVPLTSPSTTTPAG